MPKCDKEKLINGGLGAILRGSDDGSGPIFSAEAPVGVVRSLAEVLAATGTVLKPAGGRSEGCRFRIEGGATSYRLTLLGTSGDGGHRIGIYVLEVSR